MVTVPEDQALPLPDGWSFEQGAAFPVNYRTAYVALVIMGGLRRGERVLIHAAAGGVGISATQIARSRGAEIFGTASASKHEAIRAAGRPARDRLPRPGLRGGGPPDHRRRGRRRDHGRDRPDQLPQGLPAAAPGRTADHVRALRGLAPGRAAASRRLLAASARMPLATMPWWKSLSVMNENKGIFGLNMLTWQDSEGLDRVLEPLQRRARAAASSIRWSPRPSRSTGPATRTPSSPSAATSARSCSCPEPERSDRPGCRVTIAEMRPGTGKTIAVPVLLATLAARRARGASAQPGLAASVRTVHGRGASGGRLGQRAHAQRPAAHRQPDHGLHRADRPARPDRPGGPRRPGRQRDELHARQREGERDERHRR